MHRHQSTEHDMLSSNNVPATIYIHMLSITREYTHEYSRLSLPTQCSDGTPARYLGSIAATRETITYCCSATSPLSPTSQWESDHRKPSMNRLILIAPLQARASLHTGQGRTPCAPP
jgi:hypothetical protein